MESFFRTHKFLVEHLDAPVSRDLMDEIYWKRRMIGIKYSPEAAQVMSRQSIV